MGSPRGNAKTMMASSGVGGLVGSIGGGTLTGNSIGLSVSGSDIIGLVGGLVGENIGTVSGYVGGLVGENTSSATGYWDKLSTTQNTSAGGGTGISQTANIAFSGTAYTDSDSDGTSTTIFNAAAFTGAFDIASGAGGAGDGTIEVEIPDQGGFPEGWPLN